MKNENTIRVELSIAEAVEVVDALKKSIFAGTFKNDKAGETIARGLIKKIDRLLYEKYLSS